MCGMWGYAGSEPADDCLLNELAHLAVRRGPDAWGVWSDGRLEKDSSRFTFSSVRALHTGRTVIGHARLATGLGGGRNPRDAQPLVSGRAVVAHNGWIRNYGPDLREELQLHTDNDSEAIVSALDRAMAMGADADQAWHEMRCTVSLGDRYALVALVDGQLYLVARGQTLYARRQGAGLYWCSVQYAPDFLLVTAHTMEAVHGQQGLQEG